MKRDVLFMCSGVLVVGTVTWAFGGDPMNVTRGLLTRKLFRPSHLFAPTPPAP